MGICQSRVRQHVLFSATLRKTTSTLKVAREFSQGRPRPGAGLGGGSEKTSPPLDGVFTWAVGDDGTH